jgi:hypothetical protein
MAARPSMFWKFSSNHGKGGVNPGCIFRRELLTRVTCSHEPIFTQLFRHPQRAPGKARTGF